VEFDPPTHLHFNNFHFKEDIDYFPKNASIYQWQNKTLERVYIYMTPLPNRIRLKPVLQIRAGTFSLLDQCENVSAVFTKSKVFYQDNSSLT
jgi:hypothetical protein